jgi:ABC-2 type transport system permease protein
MGLPEIATGLGLMIWAAGQAGIRITPWLLIQTLLMLVASGLLLYSLWFLVSTTSIWFVKTWNATEVLRAALSSGRYPISAFPTAVRRFFTMVLPVAFLTTVPAEAMLGRLTLPWLLLSLMVASISLALSRAFWQFALRFYTSASS